MNGFETILILVICFIILTDLTKVFKFCVIEIFKFWVRARWMKE